MAHTTDVPTEELRLTLVLSSRDEFSLVRGGSSLPVKLELNWDKLVVTPSGALPSRCAVRKFEVQTCDILGSSIPDTSSQGAFVLSALPQSKNKKRRKLVHYTFRIDSGANLSQESKELVTAWNKTLNMISQPGENCMESNETKTRKFLVVINPVGGSGKAEKMYRSHVDPVFKAANVECKVLYTKYSSHATEIAQEVSLDKYNCFICVGGDGLLSEFVQGLMRRKDWKTAIQHPVAIIPAGSGNGFAVSLAEVSNEDFHPTNFAYLVLKGRPCSYDISTIRSPQETFYSFLSLEWAFVADLDLDSEKFRCFGGARFTVTAICKLFSSKKWFGKVSYLPLEENSSNESQGTYWEKHLNDHSDAPIVRYLPDKYDIIPSNWKTIEGQFSLFWSMSLPYAASDARVAPDAKMSDGVLHLVIMEDKANAVDMATVMFGFDGGKHVHNKRIRVIKTKAFMIHPRRKDEVMAVDGELFDTAPVQVEIHESLGNIMCNPNLDNGAGLAVSSATS